MAKPSTLHFSEDPDANKLLATDPMALLIGYVLDQQIPLPKAFAGPLILKERLGTLDPHVLATTDLEPVFSEKPAIHRFPGSMARRVSAFAAHIVEHYDGDATTVWKRAKTTDELRRNLLGLPGIGEQKIHSLGSVLAQLYGVAVAQPLIPDYPTLGDVRSIDDLHQYQEAKRQFKRERRERARAAGGG